MDSGKEDIAPQYRERAGIEKSKPAASRKAPQSDVDEKDPTKAALPQPDSKSRVAAQKEEA